MSVTLTTSTMKQHSKKKVCGNPGQTELIALKLFVKKNKNNVYKKIDGIVKKQRELQKNDL